MIRVGAAAAFVVAGLMLVDIAPAGAYHSCEAGVFVPPTYTGVGIETGPGNRAKLCVSVISDGNTFVGVIAGTAVYMGAPCIGPGVAVITDSPGGGPNETDPAGVGLCLLSGPGVGACAWDSGGCQTVATAVPYAAPSVTTNPGGSTDIHIGPLTIPVPNGSGAKISAGSYGAYINNTPFIVPVCVAVDPSSCP